jgi:serine/threonine protein kinase
MTGQTFGLYQILEKLGSGGMGDVYKARDTHLNRMVAIKLLRAERVVDEGRKRRFIQEAQAASALNHPNIVIVHDITNQNGLDYMVMECVAGKTLDALIPRQSCRPDGRRPDQSARRRHYSSGPETFQRDGLR